LCRLLGADHRLLGLTREAVERKDAVVLRKPPSGARLDLREPAPLDAQAEEASRFRLSTIPSSTARSSQPQDNCAHHDRLQDGIV